MKNDSGIVVLISGRGSNLRAILESKIGGKVAAVVSDNANAEGLQFAEMRGIPIEIISFQSGQFEDKLAAAISKFSPMIIALAGFMRILSGEFIARFGGRIVNIHPSLLPKFPGLDTHRRVLEAGEKTHGCTVHWVDSGMDSGGRIRQAEIAVMPGDTAESLADRVLREEHQLYPAVLSDILSGKIPPPK